jgi:AraC-like DNA-binding protein
VKLTANQSRPSRRAAGLPQRAVEHAETAGHQFECPGGVDQAILIFCAKGRGWCEILGVRHEVRQGDLLVIPPFTEHACGADPEDPWSIPWVSVAGDNVKPLLGQLGGTARKPVIHLGHDPKVLALFDDVITTVEQSRTFTTTNLFHTSQTAGHLLARIIWRQRQDSANRPSVKDRIDRAVEFLETNLGEPLQLERVAAVAGISASHFCVVFQQETGHSPMEYLIQMRLKRACELLETTGLPVKDIAREVGYPDPGYFGRAFRSQYGVSPGEHREAHCR